MAARILSAIVLPTILALATSGAASSPEPGPRPHNRAEAVDVVRGLRRVVTPHGIERDTTVMIGGIPQAVTIRGDDLDNPILLVIHGGPGYVETPLSWWYARGWEEYFTVVQWDQRGAGKTYLINDPKAVAPTMSPARLVADTEEMAAWLRRTFHKRKIFVWAHSWGSYLGLELAQRHPDWLYAYIATGQIVNAPESERRAFEFALSSARVDHNARAVAELEAIAPYPKPGAQPALHEIMIVHRWSDWYGGVMAYRHDQEEESHAGRLSPDYTDAEAQNIFDGNDFSEKYLLPATMAMDFTKVTRLDCPVILLEGRHDTTTNADLAYAWFQKLSAPDKRFVWFENSAHEPESEEPGKFLISLVRYARPFADAMGSPPSASTAP
jgi:pimeloyl-ACP methyl ester carboxylesterase